MKTKDLLVKKDKIRELLHAAGIEKIGIDLIPMMDEMIQRSISQMAKRLVENFPATRINADHLIRLQKFIREIETDSRQGPGIGVVEKTAPLNSEKSKKNR